MVNSLTENRSQDTLEIEVDPNALKYLQAHGHVFILTDVQNPQYSYYRIKGYDANLKIRFEEFVEICKTFGEPSNDKNQSQMEFVIGVFNVASPLGSLPSNLSLYVARSGFSTVENWLKAVLKEEEIPKCESGQKKTFYLYHVEKII